jgi:translation initiation factor 2 beta subunit (eIF-2beta)/eIF-5
VSQATSALQPREPCPACTHQATVEDHLLRNLLEHLDQAEFADALRRSEGICLPHLRQALDGSGQVQDKARLIAVHQAIWSDLQRDLAEFMRKYDYRFATEGMGDEGTSPRRAIESTAGQFGIR